MYFESKWLPDTFQWLPVTFAPEIVDDEQDKHWVSSNSLVFIEYYSIDFFCKIRIFKSKHQSIESVPNYQYVQKKQIACLPLSICMSKFSEWFMGGLQTLIADEDANDAISVRVMIWGNGGSVHRWADESI